MFFGTQVPFFFDLVSDFGGHSQSILTDLFNLNPNHWNSNMILIKQTAFKREEKTILNQNWWLYKSLMVFPAVKGNESQVFILQPVRNKQFMYLKAR